MSLTFASKIRYQQKQIYLKWKEWDVKNVTLSDFSIELRITSAMWSHYKSKQEASPDDTPPLDEFFT